MNTHRSSRFEFVEPPTENATEVLLLGGSDERLEFGLLGKGANKQRILEIAKASQQKPPIAEKLGGPEWMEPRISLGTLAYFLDINTWHKRCVNLKARLVAGLGWQLFTDSEDKEEDEAYAQITALLNNPQSERRPGEPRQTFSEIMSCYMVDYYAMGNGYLEAPRNGLNQVAELYHMMASTTRRHRKLNYGYHQIDQGQSVVRLRGFGGEEPAGMNEVVHFMDYDPLDPWYGSPQWAPAMGVALLDRTTVEYNTGLFQNGMLAHFAVIVEGGKLTPDQVQGIQSFLRDNATGIQNAGRGVVLQNSNEDVTIKIEKLNMDVKNMQITEGRNQARDEVISAHGVPPRLVGVMSAGQLGGGGENEGQLHTFMETVIRPDQSRLEELINSTIIASFGDHKWRLKFREMDTANRKEDAGYYSQALSPVTGWLSQDEVRQEQGLAPLEDIAVDAADSLAQKAMADPVGTAGFLKALRKSYESV